MFIRKNDRPFIILFYSHISYPTYNSFQSLLIQLFLYYYYFDYGYKKIIYVQENNKAYPILSLLQGLTAGSDAKV